jgi:hypothetical protein
MTFPFAWNEFADQPHNVAPRRERFWHHFSHAASYVSLVASNLSVAVPALRLYRQYARRMHRCPADLARSFGLACSPAQGRTEEVIAALRDSGVHHTLVRLPSWERPILSRYEKFVQDLRREGFDVTVSLLQRREDVVNPAGWTGFLEEVFSGFSSLCSHFEVGHAWNRTKWGVWDYREYIDLAWPAFFLARKHRARLVGPAVIDFEFHLYPPTLRVLPFDKVSSLLYVDRTGAPENAQFGWTAAKKIALLRAVADASLAERRSCWITEVNWPLRDTGKYSPAPGKPSVTEEEQANYLVRYFVIVLAGGLVERIFWWQLAAPGYGLIDSRSEPWRKRPGFFALKTMAALLEGSRFVGKTGDNQAEIFLFQKDEEEFAVCWTKRGSIEHRFTKKIISIVGRDGQRKPPPRAGTIWITERPQYVFFS